MDSKANNFQIPITKNLNEESNVTDHVAYYPMSGTSVVSAYRAPDAYVLLFFESATGVHTIDFKEYNEGNRQIHISFPGQLHSWDTHDNCIGHKLILSKYVVEKYLFEMGFPEFILNRCPVLKLGEEDFGIILDEVMLVKNELSMPDIQWYRIILRMRIIATQLGRMLKKAAYNYKPGNNSAKRFLDLLQTDFQSAGSVDYYANKLSISASHLNAICKKEFAVNVKKIIDRKRILEAKKMLLDASKSIKEISNILGFRSMPHFSRFMKSQVGFSPLEFRKAFHNTY